MYLFLYFTYLLKQVFLVVLHEVDFVVFVRFRTVTSYILTIFASQSVRFF